MIQPSSASLAEIKKLLHSHPVERQVGIWVGRYRPLSRRPERGCGGARLRRRALGCGRWAALAQRHGLTLETPDIPQPVLPRRHPARRIYRPARCRVTGPRRSRCAWRSSSGATTRRASSFCRAVGWSSAPSPGSDATGVSPRTSRTLPKPWAPSLLSPPSSSPSGGLPGRRSPTQQTAGLHGTVVKVCKSVGEGTFAGTRGKGEVAPIPDLPATDPERGGSPSAAIHLSYSMTSSARARIDGGTVRPSALAVLRLTTSSKVVGCCTGRSDGLAPLRILPA